MIADTIITLIIGKQRARGSLVTEDMLRTLAHEAVQEGVVDHREARFIDQLFDFSHKFVAEVMIPRSAIFYLPVEMPLSEMVAELIRTRFTRVPIFKGNRDNIVGILYARDLLSVDYQAAILEGRTVEAFLRKPFLVPEIKPATELFETFRERNLTIVLTIDEFGGITGLVTMEDLLKHIFGYIRRLSDTARIQGIEHLGDGRFAIDGDVSINEFNSEMHTHLSGEPAHTVAGMVLNPYGELSPKNALIAIGGFRFIIEDVDHYRIRHVFFERKEVKPDEITPCVIFLLRFFSFLFYPILVIFSLLTRLLTKLVGEKKANIFTLREQIISMLHMSQPGGEIKPNLARRDTLLLSQCQPLDQCFAGSETLISASA
jgi:putative hemolysin